MTSAFAKHGSFSGFHPFPHINSFSNWVEDIKDFVLTQPADYKLPDTLTLEGTVKLHGTHIDLILRNPQTWKDRATEIRLQSRNYVWKPTSKDSLGFFAFWNQVPDPIKVQLFQSVLQAFPESQHIHLACEFAGKGIQKDVAISELPKMLVVCALAIDGHWKPSKDLAHVNISEEHRIFSILRAPTFCVDFPLDLQNPIQHFGILDKLALDVEQECPFAKTFGISGTGEGIVWRALAFDPTLRVSWLKVKGRAFAVSQVGREDATSHQNLDVISKANAFAKLAVQEARLTQGLEVLTERGINIELCQVNQFVKWVLHDTLREEAAKIKNQSIDEKLLRSQIAQLAKIWYLKTVSHK